MAATLPRLFLLLLLLGGAVTASGASEYGGFRLAKLDKKMKRGMKKEKVVGAAVAMWTAGEEETLFRSYGFADKSTGREVDENTVFMTASVSKAVLGTLMAAMVERGQLDIDTDIDEYLAWPRKVRHPNYPAVAITPRMLMTHTSSLLPDAPVMYKNNWGSAHWLPSYAPEGVGGAVGNPSCPLENLEQFLQDLLFGGNDSGVGGDRVKDWNALADEDGGVWNRYAPGHGREYSNVATALLGVVLQKASGYTSIEQLFQDFLFKPLGMTSTSWSMNGIEDFEIRASKHYSKPDAEADGFYCFIDYPSGSLRTTAKDLASFMRVVARAGLMDDGSTRLYSLQTGAELSECQQPTMSVSQKKACQNSYHWFLGNNFADTWYQKSYNRLRKKQKRVCDAMVGGMFHDGSELGTGSFVAAIPDKQGMVVLLTNGDDGWELAEQALFDVLVSFSSQA